MLLFIPVFILIAIILWIMPDRPEFPLSGIQIGFTVTFFLMIVWPSYIAVVLPGLPWITPTRLGLLVVTVLFLYSLSTSAKLRRHLALVSRVSPLLWAAFLLWQAAMITSMPFSGAISDSLKTFFDNELRLTQVFFVGCVVFAPRGSATKTIKWMLILALVSAIDGFVELRLGYPPWAYHIPSFLRIDATMLEGLLGSQARADDGLYRVRGPYVNALVFSEFLAMCTPFIIHFLMSTRSFAVRISMLCLWPVIFGTILITQSRLGIIGTISSIICYIPFWAYRRWRADGTSLVGPSLLFGAPLIVLAFVAIVFSSHTLTTRVLGGGAQAASDAARVEQRQMAIPKIATHPLGYGLARGAITLGFYSPSGLLTVDNHYITTLLDIGVFGAIGFYGMFAVAVVIGAQIYLKTSDRETELIGPLAIVCLNFLITKSVLSEELNHSLAFLLVSMLLALAARERGLYNADFVLLISRKDEDRVANSVAPYLTYRSRRGA